MASTTEAAIQTSKLLNKLPFDVEKVGTKIIDFAGKSIMAILIWIVGLVAIKILINILDKVMDKAKVDRSLHTFLISLSKIGLKFLLLITVVSTFGVQMTSFIALLGAAGLAVGLALQGSLSNFAGGVLILLFKPFKVGDYIEAQSHSGTVEEIQILSTKIITVDNKEAIIPNGNLSNGTIINYSAKELRRVDMTFGVSYEDDIKKVKEVLNKIAENHPLILKDPATNVFLSELADSSVNFVLRAWTKTENYWTVYFDLNEMVKIEFDKENINIPYPQMDVHVDK